MKKAKSFAMLASLMLILVLLANFIGTAEAEERYKFYSITHGSPAEPFWGVVQRGAKDAGKLYNSDVTFLGPESFSIQELVNMVETAIAANPDGIVCTITDPIALDKPLRRAIAKGIPVLAMNTPDMRPKEERIPYLAFVGADNYLAGREGGLRMLQLFAPNKPKRGVVLIHSVGHAGHEARAKGFIDVLTENNIPAEKLAGSGNYSENYQVLDAYLKRHPDTEAVFTLGPPGAEPSMKLLEEKNLLGKVKLGAFDLSEGIINGIKDGKIVFTVEQQQYLQGYMPIAMLVLYNNYGLIPHDDILTGPALVDKSNVAIVEEMVKQRYR